MTNECWIPQDILQKYWDVLPEEFRDSIVIRSVFDDEVKEQIKYHYKQIQKLKIDGIDKERKPKKTN